MVNPVHTSPRRRQLTHAQLVSLIRYANGKWQEAADLLRRELWIEGSTQQRLAEDALAQVIEELGERGL